MTRIALLLIFLLPGTAAAQARDEGPTPVTAAVPIVAAVPAAVQQPLAPPPPESRRRPSMVGYIGDPTIGTHLRIRFDLGFDITAPDRAEFFYGKCGCYRGLPTDHPAFDPDAAGPGPGIVTDLNFRQAYLLGEFAASERLSVFAELPIRWIEPQSFVPDTGTFPNQSGLSDLRMGAKLAAVSSADQVVTIQLQLTAPTGDSRKGLGTDHWSIEPALLYQQSVSDQVMVESQFGIVIPTSGSAGIPTSSSKKFSGRILYYGVGPSVVVYRRGDVQVAPVVELVGWRVLSGFSTATLAEVSGMNIVNLKIGGRIMLRGGKSLYAGYGKALTDQTWYDDIFRIEFRVPF